jgi:Flavoprotein
MSPAQVQPVLYLVTCGGPPATQLPDFVGFAQVQGWDVCVIATPDGAKFIDADRLARQTGHPVRVQYKQPDEPDVLPPPNAFIIAPATFNTVNKLAGGISDTLALGLVNEAVGMALPIVMAPWPNVYLARHPVFSRSVESLREWGLTVILNPAHLPRSSEGPVIFPWDELRAELTKLRGATAAPAVPRRRPCLVRSPALALSSTLELTLPEEVPQLWTRSLSARGSARCAAGAARARSSWPASPGSRPPSSPWWKLCSARSIVAENSAAWPRGWDCRTEGGDVYSSYAKLDPTGLYFHALEEGLSSLP